MPKVSQTLLILMNPSKFCGDQLPQLMGVRGSVVAQPSIFQPAEERLDWVEHRGPGRQQFQAETWAESLDLVANRISLVHVSSIPQHYEAIRNLPHQQCQKASDAFVVEIIIHQGSIDQSALIAVRRQ